MTMMMMMMSVYINEWVTVSEWMNAWMNDIKLTVWTTAAEAVVWLDWEDAVERSDVFWAQRTIRATAPAHELHWNITFTIHSKTTSYIQQNSTRPAVRSLMIN